MGNTYGACGGCGGVPSPIVYYDGAQTQNYYTPKIQITKIVAAPVFDADPITPGIQMTPGVVSPIVSPRVLGTSPGFIGTPFVSRPIGGIQAPVNFRYSRVLTGRDIDPITPGIQTRPGIITATGPSIRRF